MPAEVKRFSDKSDNCYGITPQQLVEDLLTDMKAGKVNPSRIHILLVTENEDRTENLDGWRSRMNRVEEIGYLSIHLHMKVESSRK